MKDGNEKKWTEATKKKFWNGCSVHGDAELKRLTDILVALDIDFEAGPFDVVKQAEELLEADGRLEAGLRSGEDVAQDAGLFAQCSEGGVVVFEQFRAGPGNKSPPGAIQRAFLAKLLVLDLAEINDVTLSRHLDEQQTRYLLDVPRIANALMP